MLIDVYNESCKKFGASYLKVGDDSMSSMHIQTTKKGNLPHLYYVFRKT